MDAPLNAPVDAPLKTQSPYSSSDEDGEEAARPARYPVAYPSVRLPLSQLRLGRTSPPWYGAAWNLDGCSIGVTRSPASSPTMLVSPPGCSFVARPRGMPAGDIVFKYAFRRNLSFDGGGELPGILLSDGSSVALAWTEEGRAHAIIRHPCLPTVAALESTQLRARGQWNEVMLRVKLNTTDELGPVPDGILTTCVNGTVATTSTETFGGASPCTVTGLLVSLSFADASRRATCSLAGFVVVL